MAVSGSLHDREMGKFSDVDGKPVVDVNIKKESSAEITTRIDSKSTTKITYIGTATIGSDDSQPVWRIKIVDETDSVVSVIKWADGNSNYDNIWNNRLTLTYL